MSFNDPELLDPVIHCYARCVVCWQLIPIQTDESGELILTERKCPNCGAFNEDDEVVSSFALNHYYTSAIASANKIQSLDPAFIPFLASTALVTFIGFPLWFIIPNLLIYVFPVILALRWFYRYWYRIRFDEQEYLAAVSGMKWSIGLWIFANILGWTLILVRPILPWPW
ncbi:MAG: hypothetical protein ACK4S4_05495 [Pyrinomonadaceae bacterium]